MKHLKAQFELIQLIRNFFNKQDFTDVITPPVVENPGMEVHLHPFKVRSFLNNKERYLQTSPEFHMKELLSLGMGDIFNISYCFRDEPSSDHHRSQFLMLEWYRENERYEKIMEDSWSLFKHCHDHHSLSKKRNITFEKQTISETFIEYCNFDILNFLDTKDLKDKIAHDFKDVPLPDASLSWDDLYFLLFLNKIESKLSERDFLLLYEYPHHLSALSTIKQTDPRVCERFEVYANGLELCNAFNELTDLSEQKNRFNSEAKLKKDIYQYELPEPHVLYNALERGMPESSGIAMGIERLSMALLNLDNHFFCNE